MNPGPAEHWEKVYQARPVDAVSWFSPHLETSLQLIEAACPDHDASIIDVGAGASTLVDDLLARGYRNLHALDLSGTALLASKSRLGAMAGTVTWLHGDVRSFPFGHHQFDLWHDRAVFHFLTDKADRTAYARQLAHALKPGGRLIIATFGPEGPEKCSGLEVVRYDARALQDELGCAFRLLRHRTDPHRTPTGATQQFTYCDFQLSDDRHPGRPGR